MRPACTATTAAGKPCRNRAMEGSELCSSHAGLVGAPTKLDDQVADRFVAMLRAGNYLAVACKAVGIGQRTYRDWMRRGRSMAAEDEPFRALRERVEQARAEAEVRLVAQIAQASRTSWQAAAWMLEREYPDRWGRVSVRLRDESPPPIEEVLAGDDDPFREVDELAEARRRRDGTT